MLCWVVGAVLLYAPGQVELRRYAQDSVILSRLNDELPPARVMDALSRVDPFTALGGPEAAVGPADPGIVGDPDIRDAAASVVRITGYACGLGIEGSGWIAAPEVVVTNAHVVAGVEAPRVDRHEGDSLRAAVVGFDRENDLAVLRVPGLRGDPLPLVPAERGAAVALLGYPENGPFEASPARLGQTVTTLARDAYGSLSIGREVVTIRGVDPAGQLGRPGRRRGRARPRRRLRAAAERRRRLRRAGPAGARSARERRRDAARDRLRRALGAAQAQSRGTIRATGSGWGAFGPPSSVGLAAATASPAAASRSLTSRSSSRWAAVTR